MPVHIPPARPRAPLWVGRALTDATRYIVHCRLCFAGRTPRPGGSTVAKTREHGAAIALGLQHLAEQHPAPTRKDAP